MLSVDEIALIFFGPDGGKDRDVVARKARQYLFQKSLEIIDSGIDVILDWGFWTKEDKREAGAFFEASQIAFQWHYFDEELADRFWRRFEEPSEGEMDVWVRA